MNTLYQLLLKIIFVTMLMVLPYQRHLKAMQNNRVRLIAENDRHQEEFENISEESTEYSGCEDNYEDQTFQRLNTRGKPKKQKIQLLIAQELNNELLNKRKKYNACKENIEKKEHAEGRREYDKIVKRAESIIKRKMNGSLSANLVQCSSKRCKAWHLVPKHINMEVLKLQKNWTCFDKQAWGVDEEGSACQYFLENAFVENKGLPEKEAKKKKPLRKKNNK